MSFFIQHRSSNLTNLEELSRLFETLQMYSMLSVDKSREFLE
jgi:hypothetical protein